MLADDVLAMLSKNISEFEAQTYISRLKFEEKLSNESKIVFCAPNEILARFIDTKYAEKIAYYYEAKTGVKPEIKIINEKTKTKSAAKKLENNTANTQKSSILNPNLKFENFVVGDSNQFAYNVALEVAKNPGKNYNPFFIYGSTGLGKTHLLQSIGNYCLNRGKVVICVTAEQFMRDFFDSISEKTQNKFKIKYRECDVLLIDDVQFFSKSQAVQEEFFFTFNELHEKQSQIVLTCDKKPKDLHGFEDRLKSRFESGLMADITPPELDTKIRIIKAKCEFDDINLGADVVEYIATNMGDNIREIEGAILNISAMARLMNKKITLELAKDIIKDQIKEKQENIDIENIIARVAKELNIKPSEIKSKSKAPKIVEARRICIYLSKTLTINSMPQLATHFGLKDHSAVSKTIKKINEIIDNDESFRLLVEELKNKITSKE